MRMSDVSRRIMFGSILVATVLIARAPAFAMSVPGYSGLTDVDFLDSYTWREKNGGAVNVSQSQAQLYIPLTVNGGAHTVTVSTNNPGGGSFYCTAYAYDQFGRVTTGDTWYPNVGNTSFGLSVTVPPNGSMRVSCYVNPNGTVWSVNYNQ